MNDRNLDQLLDAWMDLGPTAAPDRVADAARLEARSTPQRRAWWPVRRNLLVSNTLRIATAAAVALAVSVIGIGLYVGQSGGLGAGLGGLDPAAATPSPTPEPKALPEGALERGRYAIDSPDFPLRITFGVPDGWSGAPGRSAAAVWKPATGVPDYSTMVAFWIVDRVSPDPCSSTWMASAGPAVEDLAAVIASWPEPDVTRPTDVTLGGYEGKWLEFTVPDDTQHCVDGSLDLWRSGGVTRGVNHGDHSELWILDVDGTPLVIELVDSPQGTSDQDRAQLREIFNSIQITRP
jgi:hypothetical protein